MTRKPKIDYSAQRYLPKGPRDGLMIAPGTLGIEALHEALAAGANDDARRGMAKLIARVGIKYNAAARAAAARIAEGLDPLPPVPAYMLRA